MRSVVSFTLIFLVGTASFAIAAEPGTSSFVFLKLGANARNEAMGGAAVGLADDLGSAMYNPAALAVTSPRSILASYTNYVSDIQGGSLAGAWGLGEKGRIAVFAQYLDYGSFDGFDSEGNSAIEFGASDLALGVGYATSFSEQISGGVTGKFISESIEEENTSGLAADIGLVYALNDKRTRFGAAVRHLGSQTKAIDDAEKDPLPVTVSAGISHKLRGAPVLFVADVLKPRDADVGGAFGIEVAPVEQFLLRAGYNTLLTQLDTGSDNDKFAGITFGAGFAAEKFAVDYSFGSYSALGDAHRFTLRARL